jgi:hypothetical protein
MFATIRFTIFYLPVPDLKPNIPKYISTSSAISSHGSETCSVALTVGHRMSAREQDVEVEKRRASANILGFMKLILLMTGSPS